MTERFDHHLAQADNVRSLFMSLNDEVFVMRELAISIVGRLANHNPAFILPSMRKTLIQLLTELEYCSLSRQKEEGARLLSLLIKYSKKLIKPYVEPILKILISKMRDPSSSVSAHVIYVVNLIGCCSNW